MRASSGAASRMAICRASARAVTGAVIAPVSSAASVAAPGRPDTPNLSSPRCAIGWHDGSGSMITLIVLVTWVGA
jgi:hypothetical protein